MHVPDFSNTEIAFRHKSQFDLLRAYSLFRMINIPLLVKAGGPLVSCGFKLHLPISPFIRWTVFKQFCGGESLDECRETINRMARAGVKAILDYGVEGEKTESGFDAATAELVRTAMEAEKNNNIPFVVFKLTGIARMDLLEKLSQGSEALSELEQSEWQRVLNRVEKICDSANQRNKPVMIDAEETWIQPIIDHIAEAQMSKRNRGERALVYTTIQMYRVDRLAYLKTIAERATREGWQLGIKLVRGAYMEKERDRAHKRGHPSPIHTDKAATDRAYNEALDFCIKNANSISICIGTHNEDSCLRAAKQILQQTNSETAPPHSTSKIWFSQLYGMGDNLTNNLADAGFQVAKYLPYGPVHAVLPYLIRRAQENTSVAGQSSRELQMIERELKRRR